jgi:hypothetical protein
VLSFMGLRARKAGYPHKLHYIHPFQPVAIARSIGTLVMARRSSSMRIWGRLALRITNANKSQKAQQIRTYRMDFSLQLPSKPSKCTQPTLFQLLCQRAPCVSEKRTGLRQTQLIRQCCGSNILEINSSSENCHSISRTSVRVIPTYKECLSRFLARSSLNDSRCYENLQFSCRSCPSFRGGLLFIRLFPRQLTLKFIVD